MARLIPALRRGARQSLRFELQPEAIVLSSPFVKWTVDRFRDSFADTDSEWSGDTLDLDIEQLLAVTGGDVDLAEEVLDIFRSQADVWGRMLDPKLPPSDWADAAHSIKGSALSIGVKELADVCLVAETLGRSGDVSPAAAGSALSDVKTAMADALEACARASHALSKPGLRASND